MGLDATGGDCELAVIHDGVRPFIDVALIESAIKAARDHRAVIIALPVKDTVKKVNQGGFVIETCERKGLWLVQTPQVFRFIDIMAAHEKAVS